MKRPRYWHGFALACLFLCGLLAGFPARAEGKAVRLGVLAWLGAEEAEEAWTPLAEALTHRLPGRRFVIRHLDLAQMANAVATREVDFIVTNPGHYVTLEAASGISRIATQIAPRQGGKGQDPAHVVGSAVVALADRKDLQTLDDLRQRSLAAVSPEAFGGYQVIWAELRRRGLDPEDGDVTPLFTGFPMSSVVDAVLAGRADAGVLRACLLERLERDGTLPAGKLRVLSPRGEEGDCRSSSPRYPGWAFAAAPHTPPALSREVLLALLSLPADAAGQTWTVPADYHPVHEMLRELQIGPYAFLRETGLDSLARRYWPVAAAVVALLLLWGFYTLRVEHLVQRRTRELSSALAERKRLEERVSAGQQQMEHLSRLSILGELAGTLAHELNQPLAAIGNYARSLVRRQERGNLSADALRQAADEIASESERAAGILGGIRAFARKRARVREAHDPGTLANEARALIRGMLAQAPRIDLYDTLPADGRNVLVDPLQVQQVLLNLLKNACDAQQTAGIDAPIDILLYPDGERCGVAVRDRGPGLGPELSAHLFESFFTTKPDGLGLGLSICKTIVEAHGGQIVAETASDGRGLVFRFTLPRAEDPGTPPANSPSDPAR